MQTKIKHPLWRSTGWSSLMRCAAVAIISRWSFSSTTPDRQVELHRRIVDRVRRIVAVFAQFEKRASYELDGVLFIVA